MGTKISELTAATALDGTETVPVVQGGSTKKATVSALIERAGAQTWTPAITSWNGPSAQTAPTISGSGAICTGYYWNVGPLTFWKAHISMGADFAAGTGAAWALSMPTTVDVTFQQQVIDTSLVYGHLSSSPKGRVIWGHVGGHPATTTGVRAILTLADDDTTPAFLNGTTFTWEPDDDLYLGGWYFRDD